MQRMRATRVSLVGPRIELLAPVAAPDLHGHQERLRLETPSPSLPRMLMDRRVVRPVVHKGMLCIAKGEEFGGQCQILRLLQALCGTWTVHQWVAIVFLVAVTTGFEGTDTCTTRT